MNLHPLRPYQSDTINNLRESMKAGFRRIVLQLPTGGGKTRIAAEVIRMANDKRNRTLFLAPRRELITQACAALVRQGLRPGVIMAGEPRDLGADVQVASFDTLHARAIRSHRMAMPEADLVIVDEAHLSIAESRKTIIEHYADARIVGLTATPARGDGRGLGEIYEDLVIGPSVAHLVDEGFLVPLRYFAPTAPDLAHLRMNRDGDYAETRNDLAHFGVVMVRWHEDWPVHRCADGGNRCVRRNVLRRPAQGQARAVGRGRGQTGRGTGRGRQAGAANADGRQRGCGKGSRRFDKAAGARYGQAK